MSEVRYNTEEEVANAVDKLEEAYEVELAGLNENESRQVHDALTEAAFNDELAEVDVNSEILNAQLAEDNRIEAEEATLEQAQAVERSDYEAAREKAEEVGEHLDTASSQGAALDEAVRENDADVLNLQEAEHQDETAEAAAEGAVYYAEADADLAADGAMDDAIDAQETAYHEASDADQDGTYGDHSIQTDGQ